MRLAAVFICLWAIGGCGTTQPLQESSRPELIHISSLPSFSSFARSDRLILNILFRVLPDGNIAEVRIVGTSGDSKWDESAIDSMKQWRFDPIAGDCPAEGVWVRRPIILQREEHLVMNLGELIAPGKREADSLHALLESGTDFELLLSQARASKSDAVVGPKDIAQYPQRVREELRKLRPDHFTRPIRVGSHYVIYKRFSEEALPRLVQ